MVIGHNCWPITSQPQPIARNHTKTRLHRPSWTSGVTCTLKRSLPTDWRLQIGLFADLAAAYILDNSEDLFDNSLYKGIYCDDGINVFTRNTLDGWDLWLAGYLPRAGNATLEIQPSTIHIQWNPGGLDDVRPRKTPQSRYTTKSGSETKISNTTKLIDSKENWGAALWINSCPSQEGPW